MGIFDMRIIETTPGDEECPFSPPADWQGDEHVYRRFMWWRFTTDRQVNQRVLAQARFVRLHGAAQYRGPFAHVAQQLLDYVNSNPEAA